MQIPDNLYEALTVSGELACFAMIVNDVSSIVIKATDEDIVLWRGQRPVGLQPALYKSEVGSVLALVVTIFELGGNRFTAESVLNVAEPLDLALLEKLSKQKEYHVHFFNGRIEYVFSKGQPYRSRYRAELSGLIRQAQRHNMQCSSLSFDVARSEYFQVTQGRW